MKEKQERNRDALEWMSELPDAYILDADRKTDGSRERRGHMYRIVMTAAGLTAAFALTITGSRLLGGLYKNQTPEDPVQIENTPAEQTSADRTNEIMEAHTLAQRTQTEEVSEIQTEPGTEEAVTEQLKLPLKAITAYYGRIEQCTENDILIQGLEMNDMNHRSQAWYRKADVVKVSGHTVGLSGSVSYSSTDQLSEGMLVCITENGVYQESYPAQFSGTAVITVLSVDESGRNYEESQADEGLTGDTAQNEERQQESTEDSDQWQQESTSGRARKLTAHGSREARNQKQMQKQSSIRSNWILRGCRLENT